MHTEQVWYPNGDNYNGQFYRNGNGVAVPQGYGTMKYVNGDKYTGQFWENRRHGEGQYFTAARQRTYNGQFQNEMETGYAMITCPSPNGGQQLYAGWVVNGQRHGWGYQQEVFPDG